MSDIDVSKIQSQIQTFINKNPDKVLGKPIAEVLSIMIKLDIISPDTASKVSIMLQNGELSVPVQKKKTSKTQAQPPKPQLTSTMGISAFDIIITGSDSLPIVDEVCFSSTSKTESQITPETIFIGSDNRLYGTIGDKTIPLDGTIGDETSPLDGTNMFSLSPDNNYLSLDNTFSTDRTLIKPSLANDLFLSVEPENYVQAHCLLIQDRPLMFQSALDVVVALAVIQDKYNEMWDEDKERKLREYEKLNEEWAAKKQAELNAKNTGKSLVERYKEIDAEYEKKIKEVKAEYEKLKKEKAAIQAECNKIKQAYLERLNQFPQEEVLTAFETYSNYTNNKPITPEQEIEIKLQYDQFKEFDSSLATHFNPDLINLTSPAQALYKYNSIDELMKNKSQMKPEEFAKKFKELTGRDYDTKLEAEISRIESKREEIEEKLKTISPDICNKDEVEEYALAKEITFEQAQNILLQKEITKLTLQYELLKLEEAAAHEKHHNMITGEDNDDYQRALDAYNAFIENAQINNIENNEIETEWYQEFYSGFSDRYNLKSDMPQELQEAIQNSLKTVIDYRKTAYLNGCYMLEAPSSNTLVGRARNKISNMFFPFSRVDEFYTTQEIADTPYAIAFREDLLSIHDNAYSEALSEVRKSFNDLGPYQAIGLWILNGFSCEDVADLDEGESAQIRNSLDDSRLYDIISIREILKRAGHDATQEQIEEVRQLYMQIGKYVELETQYATISQCEEILQLSDLKKAEELMGGAENLEKLIPGYWALTDEAKLETLKVVAEELRKNAQAGISAAFPVSDKGIGIEKYFIGVVPIRSRQEIKDEYLERRKKNPNYIHPEPLDVFVEIDYWSRENDKRTDEERKIAVEEVKAEIRKKIEREKFEKFKSDTISAHSECLKKYTFGKTSISKLNDYSDRLNNASLVGNLVVITATMGTSAALTAPKAALSAGLTRVSTTSSSAIVRGGAKVLNLSTTPVTNFITSNVTSKGAQLMLTGGLEGSVAGGAYGFGMSAVDISTRNIMKGESWYDYSSDDLIGIGIGTGLGFTLGGAGGAYSSRILATSLNSGAKLVTIGLLDVGTGYSVNHLMGHEYTNLECGADIGFSIIGNVAGLKAFNAQRAYTPNFKITFKSSSATPLASSLDFNFKFNNFQKTIETKFIKRKTSPQPKSSETPSIETTAKTDKNNNVEKYTVTEEELASFRKKYAENSSDKDLISALDSIIKHMKEYPVLYTCIKKYEACLGRSLRSNEIILFNAQFPKCSMLDSSMLLFDKNLKNERILITNRERLKELGLDQKHIEEFCNYIKERRRTTDRNFEGLAITSSQDIINCLKKIEKPNDRYEFLKAIYARKYRGGQFYEFLDCVDNTNFKQAQKLLIDNSTVLDPVSFIIESKLNKIFLGEELSFLKENTSLKTTVEMIKQGFSPEILDNPEKLKELRPYLEEYLEKANDYNLSANEQDGYLPIDTCVTLLSFVNDKLGTNLFTVQNMVDISMSAKARKYVVDTILEGKYKTLSMDAIYKAAPDIDPNIVKKNSFYLSELRKVAANDNTPVALNIEISTNIVKNKAPEVNTDIPTQKENTKVIKLNPNTQQKINESIPNGAIFKDNNGEIYCNIGDGVVKINLSEETFSKLFPAAMRYRIMQGYIGDCYLISTYTGIMDNPTSRALFYSSFTEDANGNVIVQAPNKEPITFKKNPDGSYKIEDQIIYDKDNKPITLEAKHSLSHTLKTQTQARTGVVSSLGIRMSEQYVGCILFKEDIIRKNKVLALLKYGIPSLEECYTTSLKSGKSYEVALKLLGDDYCHAYNLESNKAKPDDIFDKINDPNCIVMTATKHSMIDNSTSIYTNKAKDIVAGHAYTVVDAYVAKDGQKWILISNPHNGNKVIKLKYEEFLGYFRDFDVVEIFPHGKPANIEPATTDISQIGQQSPETPLKPQKVDKEASIPQQKYNATEFETQLKAMRNSKGEALYRDDHIEIILKNTNNDNCMYVYELLSMKKSDGTPMFSPYEIRNMAKQGLSEARINCIRQFLAQSTSRFPNETDRIHIAAFITPENSKTVKGLMNLKYDDDSYIFNSTGQIIKLSDVNPEKLPIIKEIKIALKERREYISNFNDFVTLINATNNTNLKAIVDILSIKKGNSRAFSLDDVIKNTDRINDASVEVIKELLSHDRLFKGLYDYEIAPLLFDMAQKISMSDGKMDLVRQLINMDRQFKGKEILALLDVVTKENIKAIEYFSKLPLSGWDIACAIKTLSPKNYDKFKTMLETYKDKYNAKQIAFFVEANVDISSLRPKSSALIEKMKKQPEKYINGKEEDSAKAAKTIEDTFSSPWLKKDLDIAHAIFDNATINYIMEKRLDIAKGHLSYLDAALDAPEYLLLKNLCASKNIDGKPFTPAEQIGFIYLISAYKDLQIPYTKINEMIKNGKVDIKELNKDLLSHIQKSIGMSDEEIAVAQKTANWDTEYIYLFAREIKKGNGALFEDIIRAGSSSADFKTLIHDPSTLHGKANAETKRIFEETGMNYEKWVTPSKENEVHFTSKDKNFEQLSQIGKQLIEDIETLRKTPYIKKHIDANFQKFIKDDEFVIPMHILADKKQLIKFIDSVIKKLDNFWTMAEGNLEKPNLAERARNTLTIRDHLNQWKDDVDAVENTSIVSKNIDVTIKMWDRNPQHDIFQGNYSSCCIGLGNSQGHHMPQYLKNTAFNMIEIIDTTTGKTIGNALCCFVIDKNGCPALVIDNVEINHAYRATAADSEVGVQLRDAITQYASNVAKDVTGLDDVPIYLGKNFNKVPTDYLTLTKQRVSFGGDIGITSNQNIYIDAYGGVTTKPSGEHSAEIELFELPHNQ